MRTGAQVGTVGRRGRGIANAGQRDSRRVRMSIEFRDLSSAEARPAGREKFEPGAAAHRQRDAHRDSHHSPRVTTSRQNRGRELQRAIEIGAGRFVWDPAPARGAGHYAQMMATLMPLGCLCAVVLAGSATRHRELTSWQDCGTVRT
jgi:hypothetical protein